MRFSIRGSGTRDRGEAGRQLEQARDRDGLVAAEPGTSQVEVSVIPEGGVVTSSGSPWVLLARTFAQNKLAIIGVAVIVVVTLFSFVGPLIYHTDQLNPNPILAHVAPN